MLVMTDHEVLKMLASDAPDISKLFHYCEYHEKFADWDKTESDAYYKAKKFLREKSK